MKGERDMERVTYWLDEEHAVLDMNAKDVRKATEKLAKYEDAEEKGLLLMPSVHNEQEVYRVNRGAKEPIIPMVVTEICYHSVVVNQPPVFTFTATDKDRSGQTIYFEHEIGKKVFLTREEAEQTLKKTESEGDSHENH